MDRGDPQSGPKLCISDPLIPNYDPHILYSISLSPVPSSHVCLRPPDPAPYFGCCNRHPVGNVPSCIFTRDHTIPLTISLFLLFVCFIRMLSSAVPQGCQALIIGHHISQTLTIKVTMAAGHTFFYFITKN
jgi:hypothetical protein